MTAPTYMPMIALPKAWTSGTNGPVTGVPILVEAQSGEDREKYRVEESIRFVRETKGENKWIMKPPE